MLIEDRGIMAPEVIVITGPTATGKTRLGVLLAQKYGGEVISADSMQIYRGMDIGTATPTIAEKDGVPHHLISTVSPAEDYSAARFVEEASKITEDIIKRGKIPFIVGGTWLYIDSFLNIKSFLGGDPKLRAEFSARYDHEGGEAMLAHLAKYDPVSAEKLHRNDKKRIVRALEAYYSTGKTISEHNMESRSQKSRYKDLWIALNYRERDTLYERINIRVDKMMSEGLVDEVKALLDSGLSRSSTAMQAIGYKEICAFLDGETTLGEAVDSIKRQSRRYAKRQLSWLNGKGEINWIIWENEPEYQKACHCSTIFVEKYGILNK